MVEVGGLTLKETTQLSVVPLLSETISTMAVDPGPTMVPGLGAGWANAIAFAILVLVLIVRPQGLMGRVA